MKLVRYGKPGQEKPGLIDAQGKLRDLSKVIKDVTPDQLNDKALAKLRKLKTDSLPLVKGKPRMGCPVTNVRKFIAIGLNYADHAAEANLPLPKEPIIFSKFVDCIQGPDDDVMLPKGSVKVTGKLNSAWSLAPLPAMCHKKAPSTMWPGTAPSTM